jgi:hypothetical protein
MMGGVRPNDEEQGEVGVSGTVAAALNAKASGTPFGFRTPGRMLSFAPIRGLRENVGLHTSQVNDRASPPCV